MRSLSLKNKLALAATAAILLVGVILTTENFFSSRSRIDEDLAEQVRDMGATFAASVDYWFDSKQAAMLSFDAKLMREADIVEALQQARTAGDFDNLFYARPDGSQLNAAGVTLPAGNDDPRNWDWYRQALFRPHEVYVSPPTTAAATGASVVSIGRAIRSGDKTVAVLGADVPVTVLLAQLGKVQLPGNGHAFLINRDGIILAHTDTSLLARPVADLYPSLDFRTLGRSAAGAYTLIERKGVTERLYVMPIKDQQRYLVLVLDDDKLSAPIYTQLWLALGVTVAVLIFALSGFALLCNRLFRPLGEVSDSMVVIAGNGDLTRRMPQRSDDEVGQLAASFNTFVGSLHQLIGHIRKQASQLGDESDTTQTRTRHLGKELARQQNEITMVARAVANMDAATQDIASSAERAASAATRSSESGEEGKAMVHKTRESIAELSNGVAEAASVIAELDRHARDISSVLVTIQEIAAQTNLLALNATIEAAHAGEQGRGFAVVADEVRVLSQRTAASTTEIQATIETLQGTARHAVGMMNRSSEMASASVQDATDAARALDEIAGEIGSISAMVAQIAAAAEEQSHVTTEISSNVAAIRDVANEMLAGARESADDASRLQGHAHELNVKVAHFLV